MVSGKEMLVSRSGSLVAATTLLALLVLPMSLEAQETRRVMIQPPTGWFGVRISDQAIVDERGNAFFDSYPAITHAPMPIAGMIRTRVPVPEPLPSVLAPALGYGGGVYPFAGAEFTALNEDLSELLGVKPEGAFVTNVMEGSLARTAGLRGGDVILRADSIKVESPIDLVRAIRNADESDRKVVLQILRKHKAQTLTPAW